MSALLSTAAGPDKLPFKVIPKFLEDLGVNLYTSLDKVLVEFAANAHDAEAQTAVITLDVDKINAARKVLRQAWEAECAQLKKKDPNAKLPPLDSRTLPESHTIIIEDDGLGMTRDDLRDKFLQVSRRKRDDEGERSPNLKRPFMGRKGLGKLAGFGVAQKITVTTQRKGETHATRITLDYLEIKKFTSMNDVQVPCETLPGGAGFADKQGTRIELSRLVYSGLKGTQDTALRHVVDCFRIVDINEFSLWHGATLMEPTKRDFVFAYPPMDNGGTDDLADKVVELAGGSYKLKYRIRFTGKKKQLPSHEHGIRIYAHSRLASMPYLFEVKSSSTGYKYTSYLDGVVVADFIDEQSTDYIATNRQTLRWETPLLADLHDFLQKEIVGALSAYYDTKDATLTQRVSSHAWTKQKIDAANLPKHREKVAYRIAVVLAKADPDEMDGDFYHMALPVVVGGLGRGDVLAAIAEVAKQASPGLDSVLQEITELTRQEFGDFLAIVQGRLDGIGALRKMNRTQDFGGADEEKKMQMLFEENPWLIDPTFFQFLSADESQETLNERLSKHLEVGKFPPADFDRKNVEQTKKYGSNKRPDLTFLLNNEVLRRIIIIEFKAPNTPLHNDHLLQLKNYLRRTGDFIKAKYPGERFDIRGILIGSRAPSEDNGQEKVLQLAYEEENRGADANWEVLDIAEVLKRTEAAHRQILDSYETARKRDRDTAQKTIPKVAV